MRTLNGGLWHHVKIALLSLSGILVTWLWWTFLQPLLTAATFFLTLVIALFGVAYFTQKLLGSNKNLYATIVLGAVVGILLLGLPEFIARPNPMGLGIVALLILGITILLSNYFEAVGNERRKALSPASD